MNSIRTILLSICVLGLMGCHNILITSKIPFFLSHRSVNGTIVSKNNLDQQFYHKYAAIHGSYLQIQSFTIIDSVKFVTNKNINVETDTNIILVTATIVDGHFHDTPQQIKGTVTLKKWRKKKIILKEDLQLYTYQGEKDDKIKGIVKFKRKKKAGN